MLLKSEKKEESIIGFLLILSVYGTNESPLRMIEYGKIILASAYIDLSYICTKA